jgi:hypothetical protein
MNAVGCHCHPRSENGRNGNQVSEIGHYNCRVEVSQQGWWITFSSFPLVAGPVLVSLGDGSCWALFCWCDVEPVGGRVSEEVLDALRLLLINLSREVTLLSRKRVYSFSNFCLPWESTCSWCVFSLPLIYWPWLLAPAICACCPGVLFPTYPGSRRPLLYLSWESTGLSLEQICCTVRTCLLFILIINYFANVGMSKSHADGLTFTHAECVESMWCNCPLVMKPGNVAAISAKWLGASVEVDQGLVRPGEAQNSA